MLVKREKHNLDGDVGLIPLGDLKFAIVDAFNYDWLRKYHWTSKQSHNLFYAVRKTHINGKEVLIRMHRQIMGYPKGMHVHHDNTNPLDNRVCNLVPCTPEIHKHLHHRS